MQVFCKVYYDRVYFLCAEHIATGSGFQTPAAPPPPPRPLESRVPPPPGTPARRLRSLSQSLAVEPNVASKTYGERSFSFIGPFLWKSLPTWMRTLPNVPSFKKHLKTYTCTCISNNSQYLQSVELAKLFSTSWMCLEAVGILRYTNIRDIIISKITNLPSAFYT